MKNTLLFILLIFMASPTLAAVKLANTHGFMIENSREVAAPPEAVYGALVDQVDSWWPKDHSWWRGTFSIEQKAGGCFCESKGDSQAQHLRVVRVAPPSSLVMEGGLGPLQQMGVSGALTWSVGVKDESGNTTVTLTYNVHGISEKGFAELAVIVDKVQAEQLQALTDFVAKTRATE